MKARIVTAVRSTAAVAIGSLFVLACVGRAALAEDGPQAAALAKQAAQAFAAYVQQTAQAHKRPDYTKPPVSQYLQRIFDAEALAA